ncbi:MAG: ABC transporter substrate-binding protein, partial [Acidimicrobiaceae bacterium]|nr:ABC transporter substrate-binding protein [Acidimicrobiaceae bacterium]
MTRWTVILLALVMLAAACGDDDQDDQGDQDDQPVAETTDETGTAATAAPETSDDPTSVVIGLEQELTNFNNLTAGDNLLAGRQVIRAVWPTCTRTLPDSTFEPYFCESLPTVVNEDPLVVEYKLRADANWSDGTPVSSDDMVFYFENCNDPEDD